MDLEQKEMNSTLSIRVNNQAVAGKSALSDFDKLDSTLQQTSDKNFHTIKHDTEQDVIQERVKHARVTSAITVKSKHYKKGRNLIMG